MEGSRPPPKMPPAGWYPDPDGSGQRYWDGQQWTDQIAPGAAAPAQAAGGRAKDPRNDGLATAGYIFAVLLPIVGVIFAIVLYNRNDARGTPVLLTAIVVGIIGLIILSSAGSSGY
jgi:uncharacterized membrane protein YeaQ/YmgE (transglycosylase-associated protein family)